MDIIWILEKPLLLCHWTILCCFDKRWQVGDFCPFITSCSRDLAVLLGRTLDGRPTQKKLIWLVVSRCFWSSLWWDPNYSKLEVSHVCFIPKNGLEEFSAYGASLGPVVQVSSEIIGELGLHLGSKIWRCAGVSLSTRSDFVLGECAWGESMIPKI